MSDENLAPLWDGSEPISLLSRSIAEPDPGASERVRIRFEISSRGDRVPGHLTLPEGDGPHPLVLLGHGAGRSKDDPDLETVAGPWVTQGAATACLDLPLHGERASAKLSERLSSGLADASSGRGLDRTAAAIVSGVFRQAAADLSRAIDALGAHPAIDESRIAFVGFSLGAIAGTPFCAADRRVRAVVLALAGGGRGPDDLDPAKSVGGIAPRPQLFVNARNDDSIPASAAEALFAAAGDPKQIQWFEGSHRELPLDALKSIWSFLARQLSLD